MHGHTGTDAAGIIDADERHSQTVEIYLYSILLHAIETHAIYSRQDLNLVLLPADFDDRILLPKVRGGDVEAAESERIEYSFHAQSAVGIQCYEDIQIARVSREPVDTDGLPADDDEPNVVFDE